MKTNTIAEIQISYSAKVAKEFRIKIGSSADAYRFYLNSWSQNLIELQEEFKVMLLNNSNEILGIHNLSKGTITGTIVDIKLIFAIALKACASAIILAHNHPSGNLKASQSDITLTRKIKQCSNFLDIKLLDHLIITKDGYKSMADENLM